MELNTDKKISYYDSILDNDSKSTVKYNLSNIKFFQQSMNHEELNYNVINNKCELEDIDFYFSRLQEKYNYHELHNEQKMERLNFERSEKKEIRRSIYKIQKKNLKLF